MPPFGLIFRGDNYPDTGGALELLKREYRITERESDFHSKINETDKHSYELKALIIGELIELNSHRFNCLIALIKHDILKINKRINNFDL